MPSKKQKVNKILRPLQVFILVLNGVQIGISAAFQEKLINNSQFYLSMWYTTSNSSKECFLWNLNMFRNSFWSKKSFWNWLTSSWFICWNYSDSESTFMEVGRHTTLSGVLGVMTSLAALHHLMMWHPESKALYTAVALLDLALATISFG